MKIVKNFGQYLKENAIPATLDDMNMETQIPTEESPVVSEEEDSFQGNSLMSELASALGTEVTNNEINYEGKRIIYPSETEMFHVDKKKFKTVQEVVDYLGVNAEPMGSPAPEMGAPHEPTSMTEEEEEEEEPSSRFIDNFDDFEDDDFEDDDFEDDDFEDEFPKDDYRVSSDDIGKLYDDEEDFSFKEDEESNGPFEDEEGGNEGEESTLEDEDEETFIGNNMDVCQDCHCDPCECDDCPACDDETEDFGADLINRNESRITKKFKDFK